MTAEQIARALGLRQVRAGEWHGACPACGYKSGFTVTDRRDALPLVHCFAGGCGFAYMAAALHRLGLWPAIRRGKVMALAQRPKPSTTAPDDAAAKQAAIDRAVAALWHRGVPLNGTHGEAYLRYRAYTGPLPSALRFASGRHPQSDRKHPMLVAAITIAGDMARGVAMHRTFLAEGGQGKAALDPVKMSLGPVEGGSVALFSAGPTLAVTEGIEDALSIAQALALPTWAAVSAGNLPKVILPPIVRDVIIAADRDESGLGLAKAAAAARRWAAEGRRVRVILPPPGRGDWNDLLSGAA
jgi:putative DNA primase/helicase